LDFSTQGTTNKLIATMSLFNVLILILRMTMSAHVCKNNIYINIININTYL